MHLAAGVGVPTPRSLFLRHRRGSSWGGTRSNVRSKFELDPQGDVDGLVTIDGVGFETNAVPQVRADTGERVYLSGDGTVR